MGKKRITDETEGKVAQSGNPKVASARKSGRRQSSTGVLNIQSTYNNTKLMLCDPRGNALSWSSSGSLGFKGAKKGTPFAASKVGEIMAESAISIGMKEVDVKISGVGAGRESALRSFMAKGIGVMSISDITPIPHNGPRAPRARRV